MASSTLFFELQVGLEQLVGANGTQDFDTWAHVIRDKLVDENNFSSDDFFSVSNMIVEMATMISDCQYNFSRLCKLLDQDISGFTPAFLLPAIQDFTYQNCELLDITQTKNLLLFIAEVYDKIETNGSRLPELARLLSEQIHLFLSCDPDHSDINTLVQCCVQVLKLTGKALERDLEPMAMQSIFDGLNCCIYNSTILDESVKDQIWNLDELRRRRWKEIAPFSEVSKDVVPAQHVAESVPGSDSVGEDECAFLDKITDEICTSAADSWNETFEQDQVHNDYEKFLEATAVQIAEKALENVSLDGGSSPNSPTASRPSDPPLS